MSDCLFHRWRLDCRHSTRKPINVTKPYFRLINPLIILTFP